MNPINCIKTLLFEWRVIMRKSYIFIILLICSLVLCSCAKKSGLYETVLYRTSEDVSIFNASQSTKFDSFEYIDTSVPQTSRTVILGKEYTLKYRNSAKYALSDTRVHVYILNDNENCAVFIDSETNKIVKYINIPYDNTLESEADYVGFISNLLGDEYAIEEYSYQNTTHYWRFTEFGLESNVENGFLTAAENEEIKTYSFYYKKLLGTLETSNHITAEFYLSRESGPQFMLEVFDFKYDNLDALQLAAELETVTQYAEIYLKSILKEKYSIQDINFTSHMFFVQDGSLYVRLNAEILFFTDSQTEAPYTTIVQTITRIGS